MMTRCFCLSPQSAIFLMVGLSLIPRFLSPYGLKAGTIYILLFWLPFLVILPEIIKGYDIKISWSQISKLTRVTLSIALSVIILSQVFKNSIYDEKANLNISMTRRALFLIHPMIVLSWYSHVKIDKRNYFLKLIFTLTTLMTLPMLFAQLIQKTEYFDFLNHTSALLSSIFFKIFSDVQISANGIHLGNSEFLIAIKDACSPLNQIFLSLSSIIVLYLCSKIKSNKRLILVLISSIVISFILNAFRIAILAIFVSEGKTNQFDFWHDGAGSLIFSLVTIFLCTYFYYIQWCIENPIKD